MVVVDGEAVGYSRAAVVAYQYNRGFLSEGGLGDVGYERVEDVGAYHSF